MPRTNKKQREELKEAEFKSKIARWTKVHNRYVNKLVVHMKFTVPSSKAGQSPD